MQADALVLNVRGGARMCLPADLGQISTYVLLEQEDWFEEEIAFVRAWLRPGMGVVDVGANYGVYTVAAARAVGASGRVWAFEPTPRCVSFLRRSLELNGLGQASVIASAVSDRAGPVTLALRGQAEMNAIVQAAAGVAVEEVPAVTLDASADAPGWRDVDFVKLDVEGHEPQVVLGGRRFFEAASPLVMLEVKAGARVDLSALQALAALGYSAYRLLPGPLALVPFAPEESLDEYQLNLFACKPDRAERLEHEGFMVASREERPLDGMESWTRFAASAPYARAISARWRSKAGFFADAATKAYLQGLEAFARSRDPGASPADRCAWLMKSMALLGVATESGDELARLVSYARVAWELGERKAAVETLVNARQRLEDGTEAALRSPFLAPNARYEQLDPGAAPADWLRCAVIEQFEKLRWRTSMSAGTTSLEVLEPIMGLPARSPEVERRWQLVRMAAGLQTGPQPTPLLCARSEENLNPGYWCAGRAG